LIRDVISSVLPREKEGLKSAAEGHVWVGEGGVLGEGVLMFVGGWGALQLLLSAIESAIVKILSRTAKGFLFYFLVGSCSWMLGYCA
jgi:hypothetical protein